MLVCKSLYINNRNIIIVILLCFFLPSISYGQAKTVADSARLNLSKVDSLQNKTTDSVNINTLGKH